LPLCLAKYRATKTYGGVEVYLHVLLTSVLGGGEWSASRLGRFTSWGKSLRFPLVRTLGGPQSWSGRDVEEKNILSYRQWQKM